MIRVYKSGNNIYRTIVKATGTGGRNRSATNSDTPTGVYDILEWRSTGNDRYPSDSYGPNDLLALKYNGGESADGGNRFGIHLHGGRKQDGGLSDTHGCMRINDQDIREIKLLTDKLEAADVEEKKGVLSVINSSSTKVSYEDRDKWKLFNYPLESPNHIIELPNTL